MQLYFTTVKRGAPLKKAGRVVKLDWGTKKVTASVPIYPSDLGFSDPNPRGGGRGGRGIVEMNGNLMVASFHTIHVFDQQLKHLHDVGNPNFVGLHELEFSKANHIWATSTLIDLALEIDVRNGQSSRKLWAREMAGLQGALGVMPQKIDKSADNRLRFLDPSHLKEEGHLHLNAVSTWQGEVFASFGVRGVIANLDRQEVVVRDPDLKPGHNLHVFGDGTAVTLGTRTRTVRCYDLTSGRLVQSIDLMGFKWVREFIRRADRSYQLKRVINRSKVFPVQAARPLFLRGMDIVGRKVFIGASPAAILCLDIDSGELEDVYVHSSDVAMAVHGIKMMVDSPREVPHEC